MTRTDHPQNAADALSLRIGPLQYVFSAYCTWGVDILRKLRFHLATTGPLGFDNADRYIHLVAGHDPDQSSQDLRVRLPEEISLLSWQPLENRINTLWLADNSRHVIWSKTSVPELGSPRFDFPWSLLIRDITSLNGGLVHAGFACHEGSGLLFLAPPAGGKSTTLNTAPANWQVLSDDAALVWPDDAGKWLASPLPAWGLVTNPDRNWFSEPMVLNKSCFLKSLVTLQKSGQLSLVRITDSSAMTHVYRALSEYPVTIISEASLMEPWFRTAARMCRELSCWELRLPLHADIWTLLAKEAA
jgi:hypothetical protein